MRFRAILRIRLWVFILIVRFTLLQIFLLLSCNILQMWRAINLGDTLTYTLMISHIGKLIQFAYLYMGLSTRSVILKYAPNRTRESWTVLHSPVENKCGPDTKHKLQVKRINQPRNSFGVILEVASFFAHRIIAHIARHTTKSKRKIIWNFSNFK